VRRCGTIMREGTETTMAENAGADFVLAAYREVGRWHVDNLPTRYADDLNTIVAAVRQLSSDSGALGLISVDEDFFILIRFTGAGIKYLLSDVTASTEWPLAEAVMEELGLPLPDDDERVQPAGDLSILADLGVDSVALAAICDDLDTYPEDMLGDLADRLGFGDQYELAIESVLS